MVSYNHPKYIKLLLAISSLGIISDKVISQCSNTFQLRYGTSDYDFGIGLELTNDGGFIFTGYTGLGSADMFLSKINSNGVIQWSKTFGGTGSDIGQSVIQTSDSGFVVGGYTTSFGAGGYDFYLLKTDKNGSLLWSKTYGGTGGDYCKSIAETKDGGYILAGETDSYGAGTIDVYLVKTDKMGSLQWSKSFGGTDWDRGERVQQTTDGGYIVSGQTQSFGAGGNDIYLIKTDTLGNMQWNKTYGSTGSEYVYRSVIQTMDTGYVVSGYTDGFGAGGWDFFILKTDNSGNLKWFKSIGGTGDDFGAAAQEVKDGGYIITGSGNSYGAGSDDVYLIKLDNNADFIWAKTYGSVGSDYNTYVKQTSDGGYALGSTTTGFSASSNDFYLIKTDANGDANCNTLTMTPDITTQNLTITTPASLISAGNTVGSPSTNSISNTITSSLLCVQSYNLPATIAGPSIVCTGNSAIFSASGGNTYLWSTGATTASISVSPSTNTTYSVITGDSICSSSASITVKINSLPTLSVEGNAILCAGSAGILTVYGGNSYQWSTGASTQTIVVFASGTYSVSVNDLSNCKNYGMIEITEEFCDPQFYIPDAFTPNEDNKNDLFLVYGSLISDFEMEIFDRWGELLFTSRDLNKGWDGKYKNKLLQEDVYVWQINYQHEDKSYKKITGKVALVR